MKQSLKSSLWLFSIFLVCFLSFIVLTNVHMTQVRQREEIQNTNLKIKNEINSFITQNNKNVDTEIMNYGLKNGIAKYEDSEIIDLK